MRTSRTWGGLPLLPLLLVGILVPLSLRPNEVSAQPACFLADGPPCAHLAPLNNFLGVLTDRGFPAFKVASDLALPPVASGFFDQGNAVRFPTLELRVGAPYATNRILNINFGD